MQRVAEPIKAVVGCLLGNAWRLNTRLDAGCITIDAFRWRTRQWHSMRRSRTSNSRYARIDAYAMGVLRLVQRNH